MALQIDGVTVNNVLVDGVAVNTLNIDGVTVWSRVTGPTFIESVQVKQMTSSTTATIAVPAFNDAQDGDLIVCALCAENPNVAPKSYSSPWTEVVSDGQNDTADVSAAIVWATYSSSLTNLQVSFNTTAYTTLAHFYVIRGGQIRATSGAVSASKGNTHIPPSPTMSTQAPNGMVMVMGAGGVYSKSTTGGTSTPSVINGTLVPGSTTMEWDDLGSGYAVYGHASLYTVDNPGSTFYLGTWNTSSIGSSAYTTRSAAVALMCNIEPQGYTG